MAKLYSGTSGFAYASWKPDFYPQKLPAKNFLQHYATRLNAVEINYTFRQLPKAATLETRVTATPDGFLFACKAHMRITHINRLKESEFNELFFRALEPLRAAFVEKLPEDIRTTFEFRNASWLTDQVYRLLENHRVALCLAESERF